MQDVQNFFLLQYTEESIQQYLQSHRHSLGTVEHQTADIEHNIGLYNLYLCWMVQMLGAKLVQSWEEEEEKNDILKILSNEFLCIR